MYKSHIVDYFFDILPAPATYGGTDAIFMLPHPPGAREQPESTHWLPTTLANAQSSREPPNQPPGAPRAAETSSRVHPNQSKQSQPATTELVRLSCSAGTQSPREHMLHEHVKMLPSLYITYTHRYSAQEIYFSRLYVQVVGGVCTENPQKCTYICITVVNNCEYLRTENPQQCTYICSIGVNSCEYFCYTLDLSI